MTKICLYLNDDGTMAISQEPTDMIPPDAAPVASLDEAIAAITQMVGGDMEQEQPMPEEMGAPPVDPAAIAAEEEAAMSGAFRGR